MIPTSEIDEMLTTAEVAGLAGIRIESLRRYRLRGSVPEPDGYLGRTPFWLRETVATWLEGRQRGPGRPRKAPA